MSNKSGALWKKGKFLAGNIVLTEEQLKELTSNLNKEGKSQMNILVFKNDFKEEGSNQPDYNIIEGEKKED